MYKVAIQRAPREGAEPEVVGHVWALKDGTVKYDDEVAELVGGFTTAPVEERDGEYRLARPEAGGRELTIDDGEAFVRALPATLGLGEEGMIAAVVQES